MARDEFYVVLHRGGMQVRYGDKHLGPYNTQKATIKQASI
jgi:hypothetical protein